MPVDLFRELADFLKASGGYAMAAVFLACFIWQWRANQAFIKKMFDILLSSHQRKAASVQALKEVKEVLKKQTISEKESSSDEVQN